MDATESTKQAHFPGLGAEALEDDSDILSHLAENGNRWLAANNVNFIERYMEGEVQIVFNMCVRSNNAVYDLIVSRIPPGRRNTEIPANVHVFDMHATSGNSNGDQQPVLVNIAYPVHCPEEVVPSFVWLTRPKERMDLFRKIFALTSNNVFKVGSIVSKGEIGALGVGGSQGDGNGISGLIETGPKIADGIESDVRQILGEGAGQFDLKQLIPRHVGLSNTGVGFGFKEGADSLIEVIDVLICSTEHAS